MRGCWRPQPQPWPRSHDSEQKPRAETVIVVIATGDYRDVSRQSNYSKNSKIKKSPYSKVPLMRLFGKGMCDKNSLRIKVPLLEAG